MRTRPTTTAAAVLAAVLASACASDGTDSPSAFADRDPITVAVRNDNFLDMTIHAVGSGRSERLGTVTTGQTKRFELPQTMLLTDLYLTADPIGSSNEYRSPRIPAVPGDEIVLTVRAYLDQTYYHVR